METGICMMVIADFSESTGIYPSWVSRLDIYQDTVNTISCLEPLWARAKAQVLSYRAVGMHQLRISAYVFGLTTIQTGLYL